MSLSIWNPMREMERVWHGFRPDLARSADESELSAGDWMPTTDIHETEDAYDLKLELPGVKKEDVDVSVDNGMLSISGEKRSEQREDGDRSHRVECTYGRFVRRFTMPATVDEGKIDAAYDNGVLELHIPKTEEAKPRVLSIPVK
jgi:HSP20 family protein